ncbi:hypothetical protein [Haloactinospora alba]|uniref:hypothetical protein n=1 Tax=Haloactinospora alba TaxID=405555 RepID=UPI00115351A4|nr:hypothetical protein [Haloactinospora alba]
MATETEADPYPILAWLYRAEWAKLLGRLADEHDHITHTVLDALPPRRHVQYLRTVLVNSGVLPQRDEHVDSTTPWLNEVLADLPETTVRIVRPYAMWSVLRQARSRARRRSPTRSVRKYIRSRILLVIRFLKWLDTNGLSLETLTQHELDTWIDSGSVNHYRLRGFINWANARSLTTHPLEVPWVGGEDPTEFLDEDQRWALLKRCLDEEGIDLHLRVAAALLLLYGFIPTQIVRLTTEDISQVEERTYLLLDSHPVLLPPRLAELLARLADSPSFSRRPIVENAASQGKWLFPGFQPGIHMDHGRLTAELNQKLGIRVRTARNSALCALAADLPAPVLADLLRLHISTAVRWTHLVRRDWTSFIAAQKARSSGAVSAHTARSE